MLGKIDVHTHALPDFFRQTLLSLGEEKGGVPMIEWSLDGTKQMMKQLDISTSILSLGAPGPDVLSSPSGALSLARQYNTWASQLLQSSPSHFSFFAAVSSLHDTTGCLAEVRHALTTLHAHGICLLTSYTGAYLGDPAFAPIWDELNAHAAVVFVHPTIASGSTLVSPMLQPAAFDFAHETGHTAAHMIFTGVKRRYADCRIILSHASGTSPILSERLAQLESQLFVATLDVDSPKTADEILADAKSFYFDLALAGTENVLDRLLKWASRERVLYCSDYPYAVTEAEYNTGKMEGYDMPVEDREAYHVGNALNLFPRLRA